MNFFFLLSRKKWRSRITDRCGGNHYSREKKERTMIIDLSGLHFLFFTQRKYSARNESHRGFFFLFSPVRWLIDRYIPWDRANCSIEGRCVKLAFPSSLPPVCNVKIRRGYFVAQITLSPYSNCRYTHYIKEHPGHRL